MTPAPVNTAAGTFVVTDTTEEDNIAFFMASATVHYLYHNDEDGWVQIPSGAFGGTFGAGAELEFLDIETDKQPALWSKLSWDQKISQIRARMKSVNNRKKCDDILEEKRKEQIVQTVALEHQKEVAARKKASAQRVRTVAERRAAKAETETVWATPEQAVIVNKQEEQARPRRERVRW